MNQSANNCAFNVLGTVLTLDVEIVGITRWASVSFLTWQRCVGGSRLWRSFDDLRKSSAIISLGKNLLHAVAGSGTQASILRKYMRPIVWPRVLVETRMTWEPAIVSREMLVSGYTRSTPDSGGGKGRSTVDVTIVRVATIWSAPNAPVSFL